MDHSRNKMNQRKTTKTKENAQRDPRVVSPSPDSLSFLFTFSIAQPSSNLPKVQKNQPFLTRELRLNLSFLFPFLRFLSSRSQPITTKRLFLPLLPWTSEANPLLCFKRSLLKAKQESFYVANSGVQMA